MEGLQNWLSSYMIVLFQLQKLYSTDEINIIVNGKVRICQIVDVTYYKVLCWYSSEANEENYNCDRHYPGQDMNQVLLNTSLEQEVILKPQWGQKRKMEKLKEVSVGG